MCWDIFKGYLGYHSYQNYWCPQKLWCSGIFKGYQCYHSYQHWPKFVTTKKYSSPLPTITQNEQALRQLRASSINGEKLQCAIYFIPESMISEVTLVTNITRYSHIFFKTSICGTYRAPTEKAQPTPEFEVETLYLTPGIIIFDALVPRAFQKYTTCMVFKAV